MSKCKKDARRQKKLIRSDLTGKIINGKSVILVDEALDYVKKQGYEVIPLQKITMKKIMKSTLTSILLMFSITLMFFPFISAVSLYTIDLTKQYNWIPITLLSILSMYFFSKNDYMWSGALMFFMGMLLALNGVTLLISFLVMGLGVTILSK